MTIRTITYDDAEWQVVPRALSEEMLVEMEDLYESANEQWRVVLSLAPEPPAQQPEPVCVWYMRDNHTFLELPLDIDEAISALRDEWPSGQTCGMLCSKEVNEEVHAHGEIEPFIAEVRAWYDRHGIGKGESDE